MSQAVIGYGLLLFALVMLLHVIIWRIKIPRVSSFLLFPIFILLPAAFLLIAYVVGITDRVVTGIDISGIYLLHFCLSLAYIASYPAVRAVSPSLDILLMIESSDAGKMSEAELKEGFARRRLVTARIDDLKSYNLIYAGDEGYRLTGIAIFIVRIFSAYRRMLGLRPGAG